MRKRFWIVVPVFVMIAVAMIVSMSSVFLLGADGGGLKDVTGEALGGQVSAAVGSDTDYGINDPERVAQYARIEREMLDTDYHSRVEGDWIIIDSRQVDALYRKYQWARNNKSREDAAAFYVMQTLLFHEAKQRGGGGQ